MALILNIETSTSLCSVSLARDGIVTTLRESREEKSHASQLTIFIDELLTEANVNITQLDAVAVSKGPGSYTGLRIGVSTAKGIAYGIGIPLIGTDTLLALTNGVIISKSAKIKEHRPEEILLCPMIDARRMEVFTAVYTVELKVVRNAAAEIIVTDSFSDLLSHSEIWFFGNGAEKCRDVIQHPNALFFDHIEASAANMATLSEKAFEEKKFEDVAYFEPFYLKDFIATIPRKNILPY